MKTLGARAASIFAVASLVAGLAACAVDGAPGDSQSLAGADETSAAAITARYPVGTVVSTTTGLNLRTGASTSDHVIVVMPAGAHATILQDAAPTNGFYYVRYGSTVGWCYGAYLNVVSEPSTGGGGGGTGGGTSGGTAVDVIMQRAQEGVGFSYWWGHGAWLAAGPSAGTRGACYGSCPSCTHHGSYGADCSGYVGKAWDVPSSNETLSSDDHPYNTAAFQNTTGGGRWSHINRTDVRRGDALVYNSGSEGHIVLFDHGDPWGSMWTYEARGCSYGIVHNLRTAGSAYHGVRRAGT